MFYVRTADRLQRTSVWLENLEGGLDYLQQIVIDDSLWPRRRTGSADGARRRHLSVRMENDDRRSAKIMQRFREFVNAESVG